MIAWSTDHKHTCLFCQHVLLTEVHRDVHEPLKFETGIEIWKSEDQAFKTKTSDF